MGEKLLIATPAFDPRVCMETYASMVALDTCGFEVETFTPVGHSVSVARNNIAQRALDVGAQWLLSVDSDMVVPRDALTNLAQHGADVCFGYCTRGVAHDGLTCLCKFGTDNFDRHYTRDELRAKRDKGKYLLRVFGGGFGIVLIRTSVFRRIGKPWFRFIEYPDGRMLSEDYFFCSKCLRAGVKLYADTRVDCGHVRHVVI